MAKINWIDITREDVIKAIELFHTENPEYPNPKCTFLIYNGKKLPAKHIRGMAYKVAHGKEIRKNNFGGGMETVRFFERLGFEMFYTGKSEHIDTKSVIKQKQSKKKVETVQPKLIPAKKQISADTIKIPSKAVIEQKNELQLLLNRMFNGDIVCEKTFPWLKTPDIIEGDYENLYKSIFEYRGDKAFAKRNVRLRCDFVCESEKLIIEYDERQHFSQARKVSLLSYPDISVYFDRQLWIKACNDINAKDRQPVNRDEIRAYYDSIRDIEASKHGYKLVRIMHGQIDFESDEAEGRLKKLLNIKSEVAKNAKIQSNGGLKVGLYLQTDELKNKADFANALEVVKKSDFDIFVLPEFCYCSFNSLLTNADICIEEDVNNIFKACLDFSEEIGKAVIVSSEDKYGTIFSVFANAFANETETANALYIKHTMTAYSAFQLEYYGELSKSMFEPILYKGYRIGMTICYDCNHSLFSRMYGLKGVDVIINSTGGNIVYDKWYKYNKVRAIENSCYNFVTMGGDGKVSNPHSYVYGFNTHGKELKPYNIMKGTPELNSPGGIYVYDTSLDDDCAAQDNSHNQSKTPNKNYQLEIPVGGIDKILSQSKRVADGIYVYKVKDKNVVFCLVEGNDILKPEKVLSLLYAKELKKINNKRYIIVNKHKHIEDEIFRNKLSVVLKVRSMENFCAVIIESDNINECYQCGKNRTAQVLQSENGRFGIDLDRTTGPEAIWKNKDGMKAYWRENFEWLIHEMGKN
ncbi:nitrilase-related carbon-nitrogen hydrolase [Terrisporobacter vanillatitrophus]|uniref:nitrilase-related carbon-nitrogen hydrolase n=1 Tax=Terrisporobacter vanillatitrophus TaxID=3058402 RepID=UPI00336646D5